MSAIALQNDRGELLGFLLLAGGEAVREGPGEVDCIFTGVPQRAALLEHPLCQFLQDRKNTEYHGEIKVTEDQTYVIIHVGDSHVQISLDADGTGVWGVSGATAPETQGKCAVAQRRAG